MYMWGVARTPAQDQDLHLLGILTADVHSWVLLQQLPRPRVLSYPPKVTTCPRLSCVQ